MDEESSYDPLRMYWRYAWRNRVKAKFFSPYRAIPTVVASIAQFVWKHKTQTPFTEMWIAAGIIVIVYLVLFALESFWRFVVSTPPTIYGEQIELIQEYVGQIGALEEAEQKLKAPRIAGRIVSLEGVPDTATTPMSMALIEAKKEPGWDEHPMNWHWFARIKCVNESETPTTIETVQVEIGSARDRIIVKCIEDFGRYVFARDRDDEIPNLLRKLHGVPVTHGIGHDGWVHFNVENVTRKDMEAAKIDFWIIDAMQGKHKLQKNDADLERARITKKLSRQSRICASHSYCRFRSRIRSIVSFAVLRSAVIPSMSFVVPDRLQQAPDLRLQNMAS